MKNATTYPHGAVSIRNRRAVQESREAFIRRGLASRNTAKATGEYVSKEAVMDSLRSKLRSMKI